MSLSASLQGLSQCTELRMMLFSSLEQLDLYVLNCTCKTLTNSVTCYVREQGTTSQSATRHKLSYDDFLYNLALFLVTQINNTPKSSLLLLQWIEEVTTYDELTLCHEREKLLESAAWNGNLWVLEWCSQLFSSNGATSREHRVARIYYSAKVNSQHEVYDWIATKAHNLDFKHELCSMPRRDIVSILGWSGNNKHFLVFDMYFLGIPLNKHYIILAAREGDYKTITLVLENPGMYSPHLDEITSIGTLLHRGAIDGLRMDVTEWLMKQGIVAPYVSSYDFSKIVKSGDAKMIAYYLSIESGRYRPFIRCWNKRHTEICMDKSPELLDEIRNFLSEEALIHWKP